MRAADVEKAWGVKLGFSAGRRGWRIEARAVQESVLLCEIVTPMSTPTDGWVVAAALATTASALVIAWQAWETRRAANQAMKSVEQARKSAEAARDAVSISESILQESQIARIDAGIPRVIVTAFPPNATQVFQRTDLGDEGVTSDSTFALPRDANRELYVFAGIDVRNDGPGTVKILFRKPLLDSVGEELRESVIPPGSQVGGTYKATRTIAEWIHIAESREGGDPGDEYVFGMYHSGPRDAEAIEEFEVRTGGTLLERIPDQTGNWRLARQPVMASTAMPSKRTYYQSLSRDLKFPGQQ